MKFKKYITEITDDDMADSIAKKLKKDCMPFIKEMKANNLQGWFYRATDNYYNFISKPIKPRKDRRPRNTVKELHNYLNMWFKKKFGWKPRSEGVFASSDRNQLEFLYGEPFLFFPIGNYKYVYNPKVRDIFMYLDERWTGSSDMDGWTPELAEKMKKDIDDLMFYYTNKNLGKAYANIVEVSFKCNSYYLVNEKFKDTLKEYIYWTK